MMEAWLPRPLALLSIGDAIFLLHHHIWAIGVLGSWFGPFLYFLGLLDLVLDSWEIFGLKLLSVLLVLYSLSSASHIFWLSFQQFTLRT